MNFQRQANRFILVTSIFNFLTFIFAATLISLVIAYKMILVKNNFSNLSSQGNDSVAYGYLFSYIQEYGLAHLFSHVAGVTYWNVVLFFYILTILFAILNFLVSGLIMGFGIKLKNSNLLKLGFLTMFGSIIGSYFGFQNYFKYRQIIPGSEPKSKLKKIESSLLNKINAVD